MFEHRSRLAFGLMLSLALSAGSPLRAACRVFLSDGRFIEAESVQLAAGRAVISLGEGQSITVPSTRIDRVEPIAPSSQPEPVAAASEAAAALPAPPAAPDPLPPARPAASAVSSGTRSGDIASLIRDASRRHRLDETLLAAVIAVESGFRPDAVSHRGAQGLMQLMPRTAKELAVADPLDPGQNIEAGARYLRGLLDRHGESWVKALASYNAGMGRVDRFNGVPPYRETMQYIQRVFARYEAGVSPPALLVR